MDPKQMRMDNVLMRGENVGEASAKEDRFDWDGGDFGTYMREKVRKLDEQYSAVPAVHTTFEGVGVHVDGRTVPPREEIRAMVLAGGGRYYNYFERSRVTHFVVENIPGAKLQFIRALENAGIHVVRPSWVTESEKQRKLRPVEGFRVDRVLDTKQKKLDVIAPKSVPVATNNSSLGVNRNISTNSGLSSRENPNFVREYFQQSRLSFIGTFKARFESILARIAENKGTSVSAMMSTAEQRRRFCEEHKLQRWILHVDMDCMFASVAVAKNPSLSGKPIAVCHGTSSAPNAARSRSEISSANYIAREAGIKAGMLLGTAIERCPSLVTVQYDFSAYEALGKAMFHIFFEITPLVEAVSVDEAFLDVTGIVPSDDMVKVAHNEQWDVTQLSHQEILAFYVRHKILLQTKCPASTGIGQNKLMAKVATRRAKPNGQFMVQPGEFSRIVSELSVSELPGIGWSTREKLTALNVLTCDQLRAVQLTKLREEFGAVLGTRIFDVCRGRDDSAVELLRIRQSVGVEINWGVRFLANEEDKVENMIREMVEVVLERLGEGSASKITFTELRSKTKSEPYKFLGHGICDVISRSGRTLVKGAGQVSCDFDVLAQACIELHRSIKIAPEDLRGVGIHLSGLRFPWLKLTVSEATTHGLDIRASKKEAIAGNVTFARDRELAVSEGEQLDVVISELEKARSLAASSVERNPTGPTRILAGAQYEFVLPTDADAIDRSVLAALPAEMRRTIEKQVSFQTALSTSTGSRVHHPTKKRRKLVVPRGQMTLTQLSRTQSSGFEKEKSINSNIAVQLNTKGRFSAPDLDSELLHVLSEWMTGVGALGHGKLEIVNKVKIISQWLTKLLNTDKFELARGIMT
eukprot:CAMPEP_0184690822 /NCGR_PEP_ID=MMETSP0312-20130426/31450_1 /TAXON_ID=31354 /ORGANISM="Compsopogon coeruleus, Strain SAG 36.94" /LENGTH=865 /DNA_ID=CAMNT_0027148381 /DNA_START=58 /DNA_END=2652 /DNA_ORIENTATION=+